MTRAFALAVAFAGGLCAAAARAAVPAGADLALPLVTGAERPTLVLAQRAIERTWGLSTDTSYVEVDVPDWRNESLALTLSAILPGAGHAYVGEGSAVWFALAEAAGWTANRVYARKARDYRGRSERYAGAPTDSASAWSFARWAAATQRDPDDLMGIWAADREGFYDLIADDPQYLAGWSGSASATRAGYDDLRGRMHDHSRRARYAAFGVLVNHVVAAVDALHAARMHNLPLQRNLELKLKSSWRGGSPGLVATLVRRF